MIELSRHIEILLLENDCVIVPELGGFIAHYQPARYEEQEDLFLPPSRTIGFNPELTMNDGLMAQSYMQAHHTDFSDAVRMINSQVEEIKETLYRDGVVELHRIGRLHYTINNTYEFHPNEGGVLSPALYGLDAFSIRPLSAFVEEILVMDQREPETLPTKEKKVYRLNTQWLGNAVAVVVAAVLFFALSVPAENTYVDRGNYASLGTDCLFDAIRSHSMATTLVVPEETHQQQKKDTGLRPVAVKVEKVAPAPASKPETTKPASKPIETEKVEVNPAKETAKVERPTTTKPASPKVTTAEKTPAKNTVAPKKKNYHIIVASLATSSDAQRMLKDYIAAGHIGASVIEGNGRFRISLCKYADKSVAYKKLNDLKNSKDFESAWILTSK